MSELRLQTQLEMVEKAKPKGISFAILTGNRLEYVTIPTLPQQRFMYFENTSKLTNEDRFKLRIKEQLRKGLAVQAENTN